MNSEDVSGLEKPKRIVSDRCGTVERRVTTAHMVRNTMIIAFLTHSNLLVGIVREVRLTRLEVSVIDSARETQGSAGSFDVLT